MLDRGGYGGSLVLLEHYVVRDLRRVRELRFGAFEVARRPSRQPSRLVDRTQSSRAFYCGAELDVRKICAISSADGVLITVSSAAMTNASKPGLSYASAFSAAWAPSWASM